MERYNSFNMIHKALRALLYDTALTLQQTYFGHPGEAAAALAKVEGVLHIFEQHAHHEDSFILPAIEKHDPELVAQFENEHVADVALGNKLGHLINIFRHTAMEEAQVICGSAICKTFTDFMVFNLEHMAKEETLINAALWKHYSDEEIIALTNELLATISPEEKAISSKWMMRGVNNVEAVKWLQSIRHTAPEFVYQSLLALSRTELPEHRSAAIEEALCETQLVA